jgi:class 3 adenylate cyclase
MQDRELKGSQSRLWALIEERSRPGADVAAIDQRIWDLFGEEWAVMFTDLSGFSRRVEEFGIIHFLQTIHEQHRLLLPIVARHDGLLIKEEGDSLLILFRRADRALDCAIAMQRACQHANEGRKAEEQILLCVGLGFGKILRIGDQDAWGREVNMASKLGEDTAKSGEILVTAGARQALGERTGVSFESIGASSLRPEQNFRALYT